MVANSSKTSSSSSSSWISSIVSRFGAGSSSSRRPLTTSRQRRGAGATAASNTSRSKRARRFTLILLLTITVIGLPLFVSIHQMTSLQQSQGTSSNNIDIHLNHLDELFKGTTTAAGSRKSNASLLTSRTSPSYKYTLPSLLHYSLEERAHILETKRIPYYVYNEPNLTLSNNHDIKEFLDVCTKSVELCDTYLPDCYDALSEQSALNALKEHPWNINSKDGGHQQQTSTINDKDDMMIHFIPTPMVSLMYTGNGSPARLDENNCLKIDTLTKQQQREYNRQIESGEREDRFDTLFGSLIKQPNYIRQNNGHLHVLLSVHHDLFAKHRLFKIPKLKKWYRRLENITVAHHYDAIECQHVVKQNSEKYGKYIPLRQQLKVLKNQRKKYKKKRMKTKTELKEMKNEIRQLTKEVSQLQQSIQYLDFMETLSLRVPVVKHVFVVGLGVADISAPLQIPTIEKYIMKTSTSTSTATDVNNNDDPDSYFIFYRTRTFPSRFNSTIYRLAPLNDIDSVKYPIFDKQHSSIGYDLPHDIWVQHMSKSKFCLAIRGDTPHTHALIRSLRAGCIPVVISDLLPLFSSSFPNIISMDEYCIIIPEKEFISNPTSTLLELNNLPKEYIQSKLDGVKLAQRMLFPDHPNSLFVQAFLQQTLYANSKERQWWNDSVNGDGGGGY